MPPQEKEPRKKSERLEVLRKPRKGRTGLSNEETCVGSSYTEEEIEFLKAVDAYKAKNGRAFLAWHEVLGIVKALGYRKGV